MKLQNRMLKKNLSWKKKRLGGLRFRGNAQQQKKMAKTLCNWREDEWQLNEKVKIDFFRICSVSEFFSRVDARDQTMKELFLKFKQQYNEVATGFNRFRNEAKLLGYQYRVSKREFRKFASHPSVSFKAFESILNALDKFPQSVLFFDASTFMFETNPRRAWQSKKKPTRFYSSTNYKRYHVLLAAGVDGVFSFKIVLGKVQQEIIVDFLLQCWQEFQIQQPLSNLHLVLDNATAHKTQLMKKLCATTGTRFLFTSSHSPFMNPVEECFRFIKANYRNRHRINEYFYQISNCHRSCKPSGFNSLIAYESIYHQHSPECQTNNRNIKRRN